MSLLSRIRNTRLTVLATLRRRFHILNCICHNLMLKAVRMPYMLHDRTRLAQFPSLLSRIRSIRLSALATLRRHPCILNRICRNLMLKAVRMPYMPHDRTRLRNERTVYMVDSVAHARQIRNGRCMAPVRMRAIVHIYIATRRLRLHRRRLR